MLKYLGGAGGGSSAVAALPAFNAQLNGTTVSGLSSGAFFAVQMHVAFSDFITGAGVFAGGPFDCALGTLATAEATCLQATLPPDASTYEEVTDSSASDGDIDTTENLAAHNVFLFSGKDDTTVNQPVMNALDSYYKHYITKGTVTCVVHTRVCVRVRVRVFACVRVCVVGDVGGGWAHACPSTGCLDFRHPSNSLPRELFAHSLSPRYVSAMKAAHTQPTDNVAMFNACDVSQEPYLSNCEYDGAGTALQAILPGKLNPRNDATLSGKIIRFSQVRHHCSRPRRCRVPATTVAFCHDAVASSPSSSSSSSSVSASAPARPPTHRPAHPSRTGVVLVRIVFALLGCLTLRVK